MASQESQRFELEQVAHDNWNGNRNVDTETLRDIGYDTPETLPHTIGRVLAERETDRTDRARAVDENETPEIPESKPSLRSVIEARRQLEASKPKAPKKTRAGFILKADGTINASHESNRIKRTSDEAPPGQRHNPYN